MPGVSNTTPPHNEDTAAVSQFFNEQWAAYEKVVDSDYLGPTALFDATHDVLASHFTTAYALLDLGCGDGRFSLRAVQGTPLARYHAVDLSQVALTQARANLADAPGVKTFSIGNAFQDVAAGQDAFDAALAAYSMHHLSAAEKQAFLRELRGRLRPNGVFFMIDLVRKDHESMQQGVHAFVEHARHNWTVLSEHELDLTLDHISKADFPESAPWLTTVGLEAGFSRVETVNVDPRGYTRLMAFWT